MESPMESAFFSQGVLVYFHEECYLEAKISVLAYVYVCIHIYVIYDIHSIWKIMRSQQCF